jgi:hypothetical protein
MDIVMEIKVSDYRRELSERREPSLKRSTQDKYLRAIREAFEANGKVFGWKPRVNFIDDSTKAIFELFIKVVILYGFSEGTNKFGQNLDNLANFSQEIEELWTTHKY